MNIFSYINVLFSAVCYHIQVQCYVVIPVTCCMNMLLLVCFNMNGKSGLFFCKLKNILFLPAELSSHFDLHFYPVPFRKKYSFFLLNFNFNCYFLVHMIHMIYMYSHEFKSSQLWRGSYFVYLFVLDNEPKFEMYD